MAAYATLEDLQKRWRPLSPTEQNRAEALLEDASVLIQAEFQRNQRKIDPDDELLSSALKIVSCSLVKRIMSTPASVDGVSQMGETAGPFNKQLTFANPSGDMYLTAREYAMLGISQRRSGIAQIMPITGVDDAV